MYILNRWNQWNVAGNPNQKSSEGKVVERVTNKHQPLYKTHENEIGTVLFAAAIRLPVLCRPQLLLFF